MNGVKELLKETGRWIKRNSPTIFTVLGCGGVVTTAVLSAKAGHKSTIYSEDGETLDVKGYVKENWKNYIPAAASTAATIGCVVLSDGLNLKNQAVMAAGAGLIAKNYDRYRAKAKEIFGDQVKLIDASIAKEAIESKGFKGSKDVIAEESGNGEVLFFDEFSGRFFTSTKEAVYQAIIELNRKFAIARYASLNDFYEYLGGIKTVEIDEELGWSKDAGMDMDYQFIDIEFELTNLRPNAAPEDVDGYIIYYPVCPHYNFRRK